ncbi:MAG TPA: serine hydrolase domain-containing protein, partial [Conexibacter sp.]|nr:serine hydrolase domain-containing protein [Conexibacter sp.]
AAAPAPAPGAVQPLFPLASAPMAAAAGARLPAPPRVVGAGAVGAYAAPAVLYGVWDPSRGYALRAFGVADRRTGAPATTDMTFRIASVTKTFTATAVLLLVDDGRVRLDAPVSRYVGRLADALPNGRRATVRSLLNMTSGFADYGGRGDGPFATSVLAPDRVWTPAQVVRLAAGLAPNPPGAFAYSNTNYAILGELVARVSGMSYGAFVRRRILRPLGLAHTTIPSPTSTAPVQLHGYLNATWPSFSPPPAPQTVAAGHAGEDVTAFSTSSAGAAADGVSTLADLGRWAASDFGNALLRPATRAQRLRTVRSDSLLRGSSYGLGLQVERGWHFHVGELLGWETLAMGNPRTHQVVVVVRNACCDTAFENYLTASRVMPALAPIVQPLYGR